MPGIGRPFRKGQSGNPGGRPKVLAELQEKARERTVDALDTFAEIMLDKEAPPTARIAAANSLLDRGYGKPNQTITQPLLERDPATLTDAELVEALRESWENHRYNGD